MKQKHLLISLLITITLLSGCAFNYTSNETETKDPVVVGEPYDEKQPKEYITISGIAEETKDGYYVGGYVLEEYEILSFNEEYISGDYQGKNLEIIGVEWTEEDDCGESEGIIRQCRPGSTSYISDIQSIEVTN